MWLQIILPYQHNQLPNVIKVGLGVTVRLMWCEKCFLQSTAIVPVHCMFYTKNKYVPNICLKQIGMLILCVT